MALKEEYNQHNSNNLLAHSRIVCLNFTYPLTYPTLLQALNRQDKYNKARKQRKSECSDMLNIRGICLGGCALLT